MAPSCSPPSLAKIDSFSSSNSSSTADQQQQQQPESWSKLTFPDPASSTSSPPEKRKGSVGVLTQVSVPSPADSNVPAKSSSSSSSRRKKSSKKTKKALPPLSPGSTPIASKKKKNLVATKTIQAAAFNLVEDGDSDAATEKVEKPRRRNSGSSTTSATSAVSSSSASVTADVSKLSVVSTASSAVVSDEGSCDDAAPTTSVAGSIPPSAAAAAPLKSIVKETKADSNVETKNENRITFKESELGHEVEFIESHKEYSSKERGNCWYSSKDKERMMSRHERVVARMEKKKPPKNDDQSYRGLESWTTEGAQHLDEVIALSVNAVMDEQDRQWKVNVDDFDLIAAKSIEVTNDSGRRARIVGMEDQKEAFAVRRLPWLDSSSDDASCGSSVVSHSLKSQIAARKRKETAAKKRERIEKGDMGTSSKSNPGSKSKSKKGKKSSKHKGGDKDKAGPDLDKMLRGLNEMSKSEHEQAAAQAADPLLTPYLRSSLSLNDQHADRSNPSPSMSDFASTNTKSKKDPDDGADSGLLFTALLDRRSAQSGSQSVVSEPSSSSKKSKNKDKKKKKSSDAASVASAPSSSSSKSRKSKDKKVSSKSHVPPIPPPPPQERHRTSPQRTMSLSMDPPGRRGSVVIDPKTGQRVGTAGPQLARSKSAMDLKDRMKKEDTIHEEEPPRIGRSLSSKDLRSQSARDLGVGTMSLSEEVTPPTSPNSVSNSPSKRRLTSPDAVKGMLKAPQRLYDSLRRNSSSKELSQV